MVVLVLPRAQLADKLRAGPKGHPPVELALVGAMAAFNLPIGFRTAGWDVPVGNAEIMEMPREVGPPFRAVVSLNPADRHGECLPHFVDELNGGLNGVVVVDLEDTVAGGFVDGGELVEAARLRLEMLEVHLDRLSRDMQLWPPLRTWSIPLLGDPGHKVLAQDPPDGGHGERDRMVPPEEEPEPRDPVLAVLPDPEN